MNIIHFRKKDSSLIKMSGTWSILGDGFNGTNGIVRSYANIGNDLYIGGEFTIAGSVPANRIVKYNILTSTWSALGSGLNNAVYSIASVGTDLYVGGSFTTADGISASRIAKYDTLTLTWSALGVGVNNIVEKIIYDGNDDIYVGGQFTTAGGISSSKLAKYTISTTTWSTLGTINNTVYSIMIIGTDLYIGGDFTFAAGVSASRVAKYDTLTLTWSALGSGTNNTVYSLTSDGTYIYAGGTFTSAGSSTNRIARYNTSFSIWQALGSGLDGPAYNLYFTGDYIYVGGSFTTADGISASRIAKYDINTFTWSSVGSGVNNIVRTIFPINDDIYLGGNFTANNSELANYIIKYDTLNDIYNIINGNNGVGGSVSTISVINNDFYVGGIFSYAGYISANRIAKYNTLTSTWSALGSGITSGNVNSIVFIGNDVYVGGSFTIAGGISANRIAKYNTLSSSWVALGSGLDNAVTTLYSIGTDLYVGGSFTTAGGISASRIAKYDTDTSAWSALGSGLNGSVGVIYIIDNIIYVGGLFTTAGGISASNIAKYNTLSTTWSALGSGTNGNVSSIVSIGDNLYIGGSFTTAGGTSSNRIAKYNILTSTWSTLGSGITGLTGVTCIHVKDTDIYVGGNFDTAGGLSAEKIAKYDTLTTTWSSFGSIIPSAITSIKSIGNNLYVGGITSIDDIYNIGGIAKYSLPQTIFSPTLNTSIPYIVSTSITTADTSPLVISEDTLSYIDFNGADRNTQVTILNESITQPSSDLTSFSVDPASGNLTLNFTGNLSIGTYTLDFDVDNTDPTTLAYQIQFTVLQAPTGDTYTITTQKLGSLVNTAFTFTVDTLSTADFGGADRNTQVTVTSLSISPNNVELPFGNFSVDPATGYLSVTPVSNPIPTGTYTLTVEIDNTAGTDNHTIIFDVVPPPYIIDYNTTVSAGTSQENTILSLANNLLQNIELGGIDVDTVTIDTVTSVDTVISTSDLSLTTDTSTSTLNVITQNIHPINQVPVGTTTETITLTVTLTDTNSLTFTVELSVTNLPPTFTPISNILDLGNVYLTTSGNSYSIFPGDGTNNFELNYNSITSITFDLYDVTNTTSLTVPSGISFDLSGNLLIDTTNLAPLNPIADDVYRIDNIQITTNYSPSSLVISPVTTVDDKFIKFTFKNILPPSYNNTNFINVINNSYTSAQLSSTIVNVPSSIYLGNLDFNGSSFEGVSGSTFTAYKLNLDFNDTTFSDPVNTSTYLSNSQFSQNVTVNYNISTQDLDFDISTFNPGKWVVEIPISYNTPPSGTITIPLILNITLNTAEITATNIINYISPAANLNTLNTNTVTYTTNQLIDSLLQNTDIDSFTNTAISRLETTVYYNNLTTTQKTLVEEYIRILARRALLNNSTSFNFSSGQNINITF